MIDYRGKTPRKSDCGVWLITAKKIKGGLIYDSPREYIPAGNYDFVMRRGLPQYGDILITTEAPLGEIGQIKTSEKIALAQRVILLRGNPNIIDQDFYLYALQSYEVQGRLRARATGTTVLGIKQRELRKVEIPVPHLAIQRKIAAIHSAYDDAIENNTQRIRILEDMAQSLYREWFVHFRFPGHRDVPLVASDLGPIPQRWEVVPIGDAVETTGDGTPSTKKPEYWDNSDIMWFVPADLTAAGTMFISKSGRQINELGLEKSSATMFPAYSVMMTSRATVGVTAINTTEAFTNQGFITCIPNERVTAYHLYFWIAENLELITQLASGATFKEINKTNFRQIPIAVPDEHTTAAFFGLLEPIGKQAEIPGSRAPGQHPVQGHPS